MCVLFVFCICSCLCVIYYSYIYIWLVGDVKFCLHWVCWAVHGQSPCFLSLSDVGMGQNWGNDEPTTLISFGTKPSVLEGFRLLTPTLHSMSIYTQAAIISSKESAHDDLFLLVGSRTTRSCPRTDPKCSHHLRQTKYHVSIIFSIFVPLRSYWLALALSWPQEL
jgi:hypothetical protein